MITRLWTRGLIDDEEADMILFVFVIVVVIFSSVLVPLWSRVLDNLVFTYLSCNKESLLHSFIIALLLTVLFIAIVCGLDRYFNSRRSRVVEEAEREDRSEGVETS
jgi:ABC-type multidrug transport system fused ATPase/permease subunit